MVQLSRSNEPVTFVLGGSFTLKKFAGGAYESDDLAFKNRDASNTNRQHIGIELPIARHQRRGSIGAAIQIPGGGSGKGLWHFTPAIGAIFPVAHQQATSTVAQ